MSYHPVLDPDQLRLCRQYLQDGKIEPNDDDVLHGQEYGLGCLRLTLAMARQNCDRILEEAPSLTDIMKREESAPRIREDLAGIMTRNALAILEEKVRIADHYMDALRPEFGPDTHKMFQNLRHSLSVPDADVLISRLEDVSFTRIEGAAFSAAAGIIERFEAGLRMATSPFVLEAVSLIHHANGKMEQALRPEFQTVSFTEIMTWSYPAVAPIGQWMLNRVSEIIGLSAPSVVFSNDGIRNDVPVKQDPETEQIYTETAKSARRILNLGPRHQPS